MATNAPYTSTIEQYAQREYLTETAVEYQNEADLYSILEDAPSEMINAKGLKQPIEVSPNPSLKVPDIDGGSTPYIGTRNVKSFQVYYAPLMQGSGATYASVLNNNKETAEDELMRNIKSDAKQLVNYLNNYVSRGNGTAGLATTSAAYSGGSPTVAVVNGTGDTIGASQINIGQVCTFWSSTGATSRVATNAGPFTVSSRSSTSITFTGSLPTDYTTGDIICPEVGTTDATTALVGLPYIIDNANTYFGLDRTNASYTSLQSYCLTSAGSLTAAMLANTYWNIQQRGGYGFGNNVELADQLQIVLGTTQKANYYSLSLSSGAVIGSPLRFNHDNKDKATLDLGYKNFEFTWFNAPLMTCNSVRGDEIYYFNPKYMKRAVLKNVGALPGTMPQSGNIWLVNSSGVPILTRASYQDWIGQIYSPSPFKLGAIKGITTTNLPAARSNMI